MRNRTENQVRLVLIRHGETPSNKEHRYLGRTDELLSEQGTQELLQNRAQGKYPEADMVFVSPLKRCTETAGLLYHGIPIREISEWVEMDFGDFEGKNYQELKDDERYQAWIDSNATLPFPNGESREVFVVRCLQGMEKMVACLSEERMSREITKISIIVHGGTIMALLSSMSDG